MAAVKDLGPLDWRTPIVDGAGRPSPEFQRRWNTQRDNNGLIGSVTLGSGAPTGAPQDGAEYLDTSTTPFTFYVGKGGSWHKASVTKFTELADAPSAYTGAGGQLVQVNAGATGLQFAALSTVLDSISSTRGTVLYRGAAGWAALAPGTAGQVLQTGGAGADPIWSAQSGGALTLISEVVTSGSQASVIFSGISAVYRDLTLKVRGRGTNASTEVNVELQFNGDTGANYNSETLATFSTGAPACVQNIGSTAMVGTTIPAASATAVTAGNAIIQILDYRGTTFRKTTNWIGGETKADSASNIVAWTGYGEWKSTAAINAVKVLLSAGNFVDGTVVSLYGSL